MAQPPTFDPRWYRTTGSADPIRNWVVPVLIIGFGLVFLLAFAGLAFGTFAPFGFEILFPITFCGIVAIVVVMILAGLAGAGRRAIPPPLPIQQTLVPAGQQGPVELACPNCGGPPQNVDRFGIATCGYCGTRFLVR